MTDTQPHHNTSHKPKKNRQSTFFQTFASSIIDKGQKFALDKTLIKGIKQNDPSKIVQNGEQADLGQAANLYDEQRQVNDILVDMRKKYDQVKQKANKIEQAIERMKKQKQNLEAQKQKIQALFKNEQNEFKRTQAEIDKWNALCDSAIYDKDIRVQMSETLKQDILFYKKNCFEANIQIVRNHNRAKALTGQVENTNKVSTNCKSLVYSIDKKIAEKQTERYEKINSYYEILNKKIQNNQKRQERQKMIENSMLEALYGKMPEEQQQKKVLMANLALKKILKMKMERQMQRFSEIEKIFRKIQQQTSVKRADQFIDRFIKRQKNYGQLLESISKSEEKILKLKMEKQNLEKQHHKIMYQKQGIEDIENEKKGHKKSSDSMNIDILRERLLHNEMLKNKTFSFVTKFLSAFNNQNIKQTKQKFSRQKPNVSLKETLMKVNKYLITLEKQQKEQEFAQKLNLIYIQSKDLNLPSGAKSRNLRIKTITTRQDTQNSVMDDHDIAYDDRSEHDYLNHNRKQIKKSAYLRSRLKTKA